VERKISPRIPSLPSSGLKHVTLCVSGGGNGIAGIFFLFLAERGLHAWYIGGIRVWQLPFCLWLQGIFSYALFLALMPTLPLLSLLATLKILLLALSLCQEKNWVSQACWHTSTIPATQEMEAGGLLVKRPAWVKVMRFCLKSKIKPKRLGV
jgi:hypothetical protein